MSFPRRHQTYMDMSDRYRLRDDNSPAMEKVMHWSTYRKAWYRVIRFLPWYLPMGWYRCGTSVLTHGENWRYYLKICYNVILRPSKLTLLVLIDNVIMYVMSHWPINVSGLILTISRGKIKGNVYNWYWQYHLMTLKEKCTIDTDNITW